MIPNNVLEFRVQWHKEPSQGDIMMMRLQRALRRFNVNGYEIMGGPNASEAGFTRFPEFLYALYHEDGTVLDIVPYDGNAHIKWKNPKGQTQFKNIRISRSFRNFHNEVLVIHQCFKQKHYDEFQEEFRKKQLQPFLESLRPWIISGSQKFTINIGSIVDNDGRMAFHIIGKLSLRGMEALLKGIEESHVLDDEIVKNVMES